ncbi:MAG: tyrosine-type recombinase/integrase [Lachnospiraceae bacterium]|nr:tyrosine-type recombinase/integrase [Lachnospiraceae bacterium]
MEKMRMLSESMLEDYQTYLIEEEKSPLTIEKYMRDIRKFYAFCQSGLRQESEEGSEGMEEIRRKAEGYWKRNEEIGKEMGETHEEIEETCEEIREKEIREISKLTVIQYKEWLMEQYMPSSVNSMLAALNNFFEFMDWRDIRIKLVRLQRQMFCPEEKELSRQEYFRLIAAAKKKGQARLSAVLQAICGTGIRVSELNYITVGAVKAGKAVVNCKGKTRVILISRQLQYILTYYVAKQEIKKGPIFVTRNGKTLDRSNIWREMKQLCAEAEVAEEKVFPHNLRHLFARSYYQVEKDIAKLADILGHSSIDTTRIYTISSGKEQMRQIETLGLWCWEERTT